MDQVKVTDKTRLSDCDYENTISVLVGDKKQLFTVYKDVICASSKFFKAACSERWIEGKEKKVSLPEVEPALFRSYVAWLYSGNYQLGVSKDDTVDAQDSALDTGVELYLLGDFLNDIRFRNKVMGKLASNDLRRFPTLSKLEKVWERLSPNSLLRKMYVEDMIMRMSRKRFTDDHKLFPVGLLQDIAVAALTRIAPSKTQSFHTKLPSFLEPVSEDD
jgi:hypothetical protein